MWFKCVTVDVTCCTCLRTYFFQNKDFSLVKKMGAKIGRNPAFGFFF